MRTTDQEAGKQPTFAVQKEPLEALLLDLPEAPPDGCETDKLYMYMHSPPYLYRFCVQETLAVKSETSQRQLVRAGVKVTGKVFMVAERKVAPGP